MTTIGYARVSTDGQSLQSQTEALHTAGCGRVYSEKQSGAYTDRPQLAKAIAALAEGDTLVVCKLDRLARSTRDLLNTLDAIGKAGDIQVTGGPLGRYNHTGRQANADGARWIGGV
jgi:DNA invertase Pin-like site-specific DNA recombinase